MVSHSKHKEVGCWWSVEKPVTRNDEETKEVK